MTGKSRGKGCLAIISRKEIPDVKPFTKILLTSLAVVSPLSASAQMFVEDFDTRTAGAEVMFQEPRFSGSTSSHLATTPNVSRVSADAAASGSQSYKVNWAFVAGSNRWLRLTTFNTGILPNPTIDFRGTVSFDYLLRGPNDLRVSLGARETGTTAALGANGGTGGSIEWVGSTTSGPAPLGKTLLASSANSTTFRTLTFNLATDTVSAFTGNGALSSATNKGVLENLGITQAGSFTAANEYTLYIDNVRFVVVPEPGSVALLLSTGLVSVGLLRRRRR